MHYADYLKKVRGCIMGLGDMTWIEPALRVVQRMGVDFTSQALAGAYEEGGALTPHFLRNMDRGIQPPLAVFDDPEEQGPGGMDCAPLWACAAPGDARRAMEYAGRDAAVDHSGEAIEAAQFLSAAMALSFVKERAEQCLLSAAQLLPEHSRIAGLVRDACALCASEPDTARARLEWRYGGVDGSLLPDLVRVLTALLLGDADAHRLASAFQGLMDGAPSTTDEGDAIAVRVSRAGLYCMEALRQRGETLPVTITAAPFVALPPAPIPAPRLSVSFMGPPILAPGQARQCVLRVENPTSQELSGPIEFSVDGEIEIMGMEQAHVAPGEDARLPFTAWMPEDVEWLPEANRVTLRFAGQTLRFGIAGAQAWRVCGEMGLPQQSIFAGRSLPERPLWEKLYATGNRLLLDELNGWVGPCAMVLEKRILLTEDMEADVRVRRTCPFVLEIDGERICQGDGTDGWMMAEAVEPGVLLTPGVHQIRLYVDRCAPGGSVEMSLVRDGRMLSLTAAV